MKSINKNIDVNEYLSRVILQWCCMQLLRMSFDSENTLSISDADWLFSHCMIYFWLWNRIFHHVWQQLKSVLVLSEKLIKEFNWWSFFINAVVQKLDMNNDVKKWSVNFYSCFYMINFRFNNSLNFYSYLHIMNFQIWKRISDFISYKKLLNVTWFLVCNKDFIHKFNIIYKDNFFTSSFFK